MLQVSGVIHHTFARNAVRTLTQGNIKCFSKIQVSHPILVSRKQRTPVVSQTFTQLKVRAFQQNPQGSQTETMFLK